MARVGSTVSRMVIIYRLSSLWTVVVFFIVYTYIFDLRNVDAARRPVTDDMATGRMQEGSGQNCIDPSNEYRSSS